MSWLLELLVDAIREMCSQFIVDMMELITNMFTELLSCNLSLFEELFSVVGSLYKNVIVPTGIAILLMILVWQLFKSMFGGKAGVNAEEPIELICRSAISLFLLAGSKPLIDYILRIAGTPYQWVVGTKVKVASFSGYVSTLEGVTDTLGISSLSISVLMLIMQFVVAWNYFKMLMVIAERYVLLGVFSYTAPLAFATGGSKATNNILASWSKMFGGQVVLVILNAWCMKMFLSGYGNMMASSYGFTKFFAATLCLVGFCNGGNAMDINDMTSDGDFDKESPSGPGNQQNEASPADKTVFEELGMTTGSSDTAEMDFGSGDHINGNIDSMRNSNVLFLELNVDVLIQLTYPENLSDAGYHFLKGELSPYKERGATSGCDRISQSNEASLAFEGDTNTEITEENTDIEYPLCSYQAVERAIRIQISYDALKNDHPYDRRVEEILGLILDVMVSTAPKLRINREEKDIEIVKAQFAKLTKDHVEFVLQSMDDTSTKARNIRAVLLTALYNSVNTINSYYGNRYHFHLAEETRREMEETD